MSFKGKDIAKMLGVSPSTLSIVLNNKPGVSEQTRTRVINKIKELHCEYLFKNKIDDANLISEDNTIGFVVYKRFGDIINESPFFNYALESITSTLGAEGYNLKFVYLDKNLSAEDKQKILTDSNCIGFIVYAVEMYEDDLEIFIQKPFPFVLLDNSFQARDVDCVAINNTQGIYKAMRYFYSMGHRKIGYIKSSISITSFKERYREYRYQLEELGLEFNPDFVIETGYSEDSVVQKIGEHLGMKKELPTAFLADNDLLGCYAMQAFKKRGFSIPEDISIIGFDDRPICRLVEPPLTTIAVPLALFGPSAVKLLVKKIQNPRTQSLKIDIGINLVERQSVKRL